MKVGFVQTSPSFGEKEENFREVMELIEQGPRADLLVLPELFATGYAFTSRIEANSLAEDARTGDTATFLKELSLDKNMAIIAGFAERDGDAVYNSAMLANKGEIIDVYRKVHLFNKEKLWFDPGNIPFHATIVPGLGEEDGIKDVKVGMMICFDWLFPEAARSLALDGADIIAHPANLVLPYCQAAMVTRCLENNVHAITANRIGHEQRGDDDFTFTGGSQVVGPRGNLLVKATGNETGVQVVEIDVVSARDKNINEYNDKLNDRRPDLYSL